LFSCELEGGCPLALLWRMMVNIVIVAGATMTRGSEVNVM
jgi:hypothetical protein